MKYVPSTFANILVLKETRTKSVNQSDIKFEDIRDDMLNRQHFDKAIIKVKNFHAVLDFYGLAKFDLDIDNLHDQSKQFDLNINLYVGTPSDCESYVRPLRQKYKNTINLLLDQNKVLTHLILNEQAIKKVYNCTVSDCPFFTDNRGTFAKHIETCKDTRNICAKQKIYGQSDSTLSSLITDGYLPEESRNFSKKHFACFDIETLEYHENSDIDFNEKREGLTYKNELRLCSIAVGSNIQGIETKCFIRKDSSPESAESIIQEFFEYLAIIKQKYDAEIPNYYNDAIAKIEEEIKKLNFSAEQRKLYNYLQFLKNITSLIIYGFNSSKFDLPILMPYLITIGGRLGFESNCIKKGLKYINFTMGPYIFRDILQLSSPCTLSKYLSTWGESEGKGIFPYEKYNSIEELSADLTFPPREDFYSSLKGDTVSHEDYDDAKTYFENNCDSMKNYLDWYNCQDVDPFIRAIERQFAAFNNLFGVNLLSFISLPSVASKICYNLYEKSSAFTWSFSDTELLISLRKSVVGGLSSVFHRMINTYDESGPISARFAKNGDPYTYFVFYDFNSLYLWCQGEELPVGPGIKWEKKDDKFTKKIMCTQTSFSAIQWLTYMQEYSDCLINDDGSRAVLQTYHFRGEKEINGFYPDGYAEVVRNGKIIQVFLEFDGCRNVLMKSQK